MILVVLNYTFLYLDRLFSFFVFFQKQTSLNSCGTISLYEICLNLSFESQKTGSMVFVPTMSAVKGFFIR